MSNLTPTPDRTPDGTRELLQGGLLILVTGIACFAVLILFLGGLDRDGAHSNAGWMALVIGMMCLPFGLLLFLLGVAKHFRRR